MLENSSELRFANEFAKCVRGSLQDAGLAGRIRFITSLDLQVILGRVNALFSEKFKTYFVGAAQGIRYDTPKIVEAILRLRLLGNGVPILRLDHDVIFRGNNKDIGDLGLFKAVACALRAYHLRLAEPSVSTFLFSASYNSRSLLQKPVGMDTFEAWGRAFATRIYPALIADPEEIGRICAMPQERQSQAWNDYVRQFLDDGFARKFYGLRDIPGILETDGTTGLTGIGAHAIFSVISGAMLCLSEGAILDLPPFSNFRHNVMWIDDHLKYSLHRAMQHFTSGETLDLERGLSDARLDDVTVTKARPGVDNLPMYVFQVYLPTLLWGTVMDRWINADPILKCRVGTLDSGERKLWRHARDRQQDAPLPKALLEALRVGHFGMDAQNSLRDELKAAAVVRIDEVRQLWSNLRNGNIRSFASYWAEGEVKNMMPSDYFSSAKVHLWEGIAPGKSLSARLTSIEELSPSLMKTVLELCDDAVTYIHWTLEWPKFVQIVRSIPQGTFAGDMTWPNAKHRS